jgi:hypothetical protein
MGVMWSRLIPAIATLALGMPLQAASLPPSMAYATYRMEMLRHGWRPDPAAPRCGGPYAEVCMGNGLGSARFVHPISGESVEIILWPCMQGICLAPSATRQ